MACCAAAVVATAARPALARSKRAAVIPDDRRIEWRPGIPGGIPRYPVFASVTSPRYGAKGDGKADDTAAIQKAIDDCPAGKAVHVPAGTYRLTDELRINKGIALRGDGPDKTRLINEAKSKSIIGIWSWSNHKAADIVEGHVKGSTRIVVDDAGAFRTGDLLLIDQLNEPELVDNKGCGGVCGWAGREKGERAMGQLVQLVGKAGRTLTLARPICYTFKKDLKPQVVLTTKETITGAGVEDLYIEGKTPRRSDNRSTIKIMHGIHCWVKNVESYKSWFGGHVTLQTSLGCEIRDSYFHHANRFGAGHGYGVWVFSQTTDTLVENNVFYYLNSAMMIECGGPGNVFAYNFASRTFGRDYPDTDWAHADISLHGAHGFMNLFEGNQVSTFGADFYWGSASHTTVFRNSMDMDCRMTDGRPMMAVIAVRLDTRNYYMNIIGNILGRQGVRGVVETPMIANYNQNRVWSMGYRTPSGTGAPDDAMVASTVLRHGNYDHISKKITWDPNTRERTLPNSLYLKSKPKFFGKLNWPPIGPDVTPNVGAIPARERFMRMPPKEREAQDLLFMGEYLLADGKREKARAAFVQIIKTYARTSYATEARVHLKQMK